MRAPANNIPMAMPATAPPASPVLPVCARVMGAAAEAVDIVETAVDVPSKVKEPAGVASVPARGFEVTGEVCVTPGLAVDEEVELRRLEPGPVHVGGSEMLSGQTDGD